MPALRDTEAWKIVLAYAEDSDTTFPEVIEQLTAHLADRYIYEEWKPAFDAVFAADGDPVVAVMAVTNLMDTHTRGVDSQSTSSRANVVLSSGPNEEETKLLKAISELQARNRIRTPLTLEELLNPVEEREIGEPTYGFSDNEDNVINYYREEQLRMNQKEECDETSDEEESDDDKISAAEGISLCQKLEKLALTHSDAEGVSAVELQRQLRRLCGHLRRVDADAKQQSTLDGYLGRDLA